ncbi:hypothetical protein BDD12DRAFT_879760 [Trichophaea hybrida]|nr:hypothetical protein BDD12DRAFT_879760 [Trichophaea hybrida]
MFALLDSDTSNTPKQTPQPKSPQPTSDSSMMQSPSVVEDMARDCIFCLSNIPVDSIPLTGEYEPVAQLVPCSHFMHNHCLKPWTEIANTCPICRVSFNQVNVLPHMTGPVLSSWQVEDRVQRVTDQGVDIPPEEDGGGHLHNDLGLHDEVVYVYDQAAATRSQREWVAAWERLDADLEQTQPEEDDDLDGYYDIQDAVNQRQYRQRQQRMDRRRALAASQTRHGLNPFDEPVWAIPTTRPRATFPHLQHQMSKEESDSWKMMELAEKLENSKTKRRRSPISEERLLARLGVDLSTDPEKDGRKFKRPRTKRDSQLPAINTRNINNSGESSSAMEATPATASTPTGNTSDAGSPPSGGLFTTLLEGIGKFQDVPIISAADVSGCNLARMRPISPDRSSVTSVISRSRSPPAIYSPSSPPSSRPTSPGDERFRGRSIYSPISPTRTPAHSPTRSSRKRPWETQLSTSPPVSRMQSPDGRPGKRQHSHSPEPSRAGESSASDSDSSRQQQPKYSITKENKSDIVNMVSAALKPFYPEKISKELYTEINKKISRRMYKLVCENGIMDKQQWHQIIETDVKKEVNAV